MRKVGKDSASEIVAGIAVLILLSCSFVAAGRIGAASQTCTNAQASHHVLGSFNWTNCVAWNAVYQEDNDN
jgi:hypothetical protein